MPSNDKALLSVFAGLTFLGQLQRWRYDGYRDHKNMKPKGNNKSFDLIVCPLACTPSLLSLLRSFFFSMDIYMSCWQVT